jgi:transcriptional regulator with XRE-family HTH domain
MKQYSAMDRFTINAETLRLEKGFTIQALADCIGMERSQLSNILSGKNSPTLDTMERIAIGLGVDVADLLTMVTRKQAAQVA